MQYLPPVGCGRSSESLLYHYSGEPANIFGDFCILLRLNGTQGDWQGSQPSLLFLPNILVSNTCHQGAWEGHPSHFFLHDGGVRVKHFYDFCNFLRPNGTLGGW